MNTSIWFSILSFCPEHLKFENVQLLLNHLLPNTKLPRRRRQDMTIPGIYRAAQVLPDWTLSPQECQGQEGDSPHVLVLTGGYEDSSGPSLSYKCWWYWGPGQLAEGGVTGGQGQGAEEEGAGVGVPVVNILIIFYLDISTIPSNAGRKRTICRIAFVSIGNIHASSRQPLGNNLFVPRVEPCVGICGWR